MSGKRITPVAALLLCGSALAAGPSVSGSPVSASPPRAAASDARPAAAAGMQPLVLRSPRDGAFVATPTPRIELRLAGGALDVASLRVAIDGVDRTGWFTVGPRAATADLAAGPADARLADGRHTLEASARDAAGETRSLRATFTVDTVAPQLAVVEPAAGALVSGSAVDVRGGVIDASPVTVSVGESEALVRKGAFAALRVPLAAGPELALPLVARDAAGNTTRASLALRVEREAPVVRIESPRAEAEVKGPTLRVSGTVRAAGASGARPASAAAVAVEVNGIAATVAGGSWSADVPAASGRLELRAVARSVSGLRAEDTVGVSVDGEAPVLEVDSPQPDTTTNDTSVRVAGRVSDPRASVRVNGRPAPVKGGAFSTQVALPNEGPQKILVLAQDPAGNRREVEIPLVVDRTAPDLRLLSQPEGAPVDGRAVTVAGAAFDAGAVSVTVNGQPAERLARGWRADLSGLAPGTHEVVAVARDEAGNETRLTQTLTVVEPEGDLVVATAGGALEPAPAAATSPLARSAYTLAAASPEGQGAVVGQVLSDQTGLPIAGATVRLSPGDREATTDTAGRYSFATAAGPVVIVVEKAGMTRAERTLAVEAGVGHVAIDARLTPLAPVVAIDADGGSLLASFPRRLRPPDPDAPAPPPAATLTLTLPAGALASAASFRLTPLGSQGLPGLLPLGWSPIAAFHLDAGAPPASIEALASGLPALPLHLARWDDGLHAWTLAAAGLEPVDGTLAFALPGLGSFALVAADPGPGAPALPPPGEPLPGAAFAAIADGAVGRSFADPPSLPSAGGAARGRVEVDSPSALPSGTVVQAVLRESYRLVSGESATEDERYEDILLFRADLDGPVEPAAGAGASGLAAEIPIVASREHAPTELEEGRVLLRVLAGRDGARGAGGGNAVTVSADGVSLSIAAGSLPEDTAVALSRAASPSPFVPQPPGLIAVAEVVIDVAGASLALPAELRVAAAGAPAGGSLFVARAERVGNETRLRVVAWAERQGDEIVTVARPHLPGLRQGGRHVVYHAAPAVAFLVGVTRGGTDPRPALVTTSGLPFVGVSGTDGVYSVLALAGEVRATARVLGTSLVGHAEAVLAQGSVAPLDIAVSQAVTLAYVTPASGSAGFPVTRQIELEASAPLDPATVVPASLSLRRASDLASVAVRTVLSADARHVAVIPAALLAYQTTYAFESTGLLRDVYGAPVAVPVVEFTTAARDETAVDAGALVFSYPVDGMVTMRAPAGALPAGTQILVLNASVGSALTYSVGAQAVEAELRASIDDRLWVTLTDPSGKVTTFERTEYVAPDGTTAVGVAGGTVRGPDGSEMRLPAGVTDGAVTLKLGSFAESALPAGQRPDLPGASFGYGLTIESADKPHFKREVDLVFPRPADAPEGAFFYVYRTIELPGGRVAFETIDQALEEGGKVVTASFPFGGYQTSFGVLGMGGGMAQLQAQSRNSASLMWTYDELSPGRATAGAITGQVLRAGVDPATGDLVYEPIPGAIVTGVNAANHSLLTDMDANSVSTAVSQGDGTFTMLDSRYTGGLVLMSATTPQGETKTATAYQGNPLDSENHGLRFFSNIARVTFTFDPLVEAPGPAVVDVSLVRLGDVGQRLPTDGLVVEGSRLLVGVRQRNADVEQIVIGGASHAFSSDPAPMSEPLRFDVVTSQEFVASPPGMYRVEVTARDQAGNPRTVSQSFRVVPLGGGNGLPALGEAPEVLDARTFPDRGARAVEVTALPQVEFSEPVRNIPGQVRLVEIDEGGVETPVSIRLLGVPPGLEATVDVTPLAQASQPIVSLIVRPQPGLRFGKRYRLELTDAILDLDPPGDAGPRSLVAYTTEFETATLAAARSQGDYPTGGIVFQDGFAYLAESAFTHGTLKVYDVRDPARPEAIPSADRPIENRPIDLAARPRRVVVGTTVPARSVPSNLHVFDVSRPDDPQWVGAASVSNGVLDGTLRRVVVHGSYAYGLVHRKGVQVVDLRVAEANVAATGGPSQPAYWTMRRALNTDGQGFGMDAIVATIPLPVTPVVQWYPHDLDVGDYVLDNRPQPLVVVGAEERLAQTCSLLVGSVLGARVESSTRLRAAGDQDLCPVLVALGRVAGRDVAVLAVAYGPTTTAASGFGLAVVDMANPRSPQLLGLVRLDLAGLADLVLDGETALVSSPSGGTAVVSLGSPDFPYVSGHIDNLSGRLGVGADGTYVSSGGTFDRAPEGGLHVAGGAQCNLLDLREDRLLLEVVRDPVDGALCGGGDVLVFNVCEASHVTLRIDGRLESLSLDGQASAPITDVPLAPGWHTIQVPFGAVGTGLDTVKPFVLSARSQADSAVVAERQGTIQNKLLNRPVLPIGRTFVKGVDLFDGHVVRQATDLKIQGRHLGLELTRTYSSASRGEDGRVGAGWGWNYDAAVSPMSCGLYNVSTADGGGQVFRSNDGGQSFTPQRGYHGRLNRMSDRGYEYVDKAGVKHYFREPVDPAQPDGARRLERVVEPHGDRLELTYDLQGRIGSVREVLRGERPVRSLDIRYVRAYGHDRVASVETSLGHRVDYGYDAKGNLVSVRRSGLNVDGGADSAPMVESYEYTAASFRDPHQITAAVGPNGDRVEYRYYEGGDDIPGAGIALTWIVSHKEELAREVKEIAGVGPVPEPVTGFSYDFSQGGSAVYTTTVRDARGSDSVYTLNSHGSPTRILEPLGKETVIGWKPNDILKADEQDALGRITRYEYDPRGNLALERIEKDAALIAETAYEYDAEYNKLTYKRDAEGRETRHTIDPATGDLLATEDAVGNRTEYRYDPDGRLEWTKDPRGFTTLFRAFNDFGSPREIVNPLGQLTSRVYDSRNRLLEERQDPYGRVTQVAYDGFDRPVEQVGISGAAGSADARTLTEYYPGGQPRAVTNALGARTEYTLDGLNRLTRTSVVAGGETLTTETEYDGNGNAAWEKDRRGVARRSVFDALNRLARVEIESTPNGEGPIGPVAAYGYDLAGNKTSETDVNGIVTEFRYDGLYHLEKKILPVVNPQTSTRYEERYLHDKVGNLRRLTDANGKITETEYDGLNRPTRLTRDVGGLGLVTTTKYDDPESSHVHKSEERDLARGLKTTYLYDELGRERERKVHLEGEDGSPAPNPGPYTTTTVYVDAEHAVRVSDPRGVQTLRKLDGLDRVVEETVDVAGLAPASPLGLITTVSYDGLGNKTEATDPEGRTTSFDYDELGRLVTTTDAAGEEATATWFGDGLKASETDRRGVKRLFDYDGLGRPRKTRLAAAPFSGVGWSQETRYLDGLQPKRVELDARGKPTTFEMDGLGRAVKETDALDKSRTFTWDGVNKIAETDKRGNTTRFEHDGLNRLKKTTDPLVSGEPAAHTVETTYEDALNRVTTKDRRGYLTRTQSDPLGRVVTVTRALGTPDEAVLETNAYDANGNKTLATDAEGRKTRFDYDAANRLKAREDGFESPAAAVTTFLYDKAGNLLEERDPRAAALGDPWSVKRTYDALNRLATETDGETNVTTYGYDPEGNRTSIATPRGTTTSFEYDELGKLTKVIQPAVMVQASGGGAPTLQSPTTAYVYDENRNRITQTDANGNVVAMEYDDLNRLKKTTQDPNGLTFVTETTVFDENGNAKVIVDPKGQTITNTYDELNRLTKKEYAFAAGDTARPWRYTAFIDYAYDPNGNLLTTDEHVASGLSPPDTTLTTTRVYDGLARLMSEMQPLPGGAARTVGYSYYKNGTRQTVTDPGGSVTQYTYDGRNRLATATTEFGTAQAKTTSYSYEPDDLLKTVTYPNGVVATHAYDKADRLLSIVNAKDAVPLSSYQYSGIHPTTGLPVSYDANGNRLIQVETNGGAPETTTYSYDDLDRLETVTYPVDANYPNGRVVSYGYDAVGNRTRETERDLAAAILADKQGVFDNANRLTELQDLVTPANSTAFTWDANGNQLTKTTAGVTTENRYDLRDKLVESQILGSPAPLARFQYDAGGRRNLKIGDEDLRQYVYDQTSLLTEYDAGGLQKAKYDYGSDRLISLTRADEGRRYFSLDGLRSVVNLTDDFGNEVASYHLDAWGNFRFPSELTQSANRFAFTGHIYDPETGLYNAKARYFDPKLGRFLTQDSFLGQIDEPPSLHRYAYGWNRPTFYIDPDGHSVREALNWGVDFAGAFVDDLTQNAGRRAYKVGEAVVSNAAHMVVEAGAQTHDVLVLAADAGKRTVTGKGLENVELWSDTAKSAGQAFAEGKSTSEVILESAKQVAVGTLSAGIVPTVQQQYSALADFSAGKATIEDVENRLADAAGGAILNAGLASYASAKLGHGLRGQPISTELAQLAERGSAIARGAKGLFEGGVERLHDAFAGKLKPSSNYGPGAARLNDPGFSIQRSTSGEVLSIRDPIAGREHGVGPYSRVRSHHIIQASAVDGIQVPGFAPVTHGGAPAIDLGASLRRGTPHHATRAAQQMRGGGTYGAERRIGYRALREAGFTADQARALIEEVADPYFEARGFTRSTPTRIPGDRSR